MADYARLAIDSGARIIGGCCGTSCDHLAAMREAVDNHIKAQRPTVETIVERIGPMRNTVAAPAPTRERRGRRS